MPLIDFILNLAGLLLWVAWRTIPFDPLTKLRPATLTGTLRRAEKSQVKRWHFLAALGVLLLVRSVFYWWIGGALSWTPGVKLGAISVPFYSNLFWLRMLPFSFASFADTLAVFYLWLLLFSLTNPHGADTDVWLRFVRVQLGLVYFWPRWIRFGLPFAAALALWLAAGPLLARVGIVPPTQSFRHLLEQGVVLGLGIYLLWKYAIGAVLALHLLNSYVHFGDHPAWNFVNVTGRNLLKPLRHVPLRIGRMDFAPVVGIAVVFGLAELAERGLTLLYARLPL